MFCPYRQFRIYINGRLFLTSASLMNACISVIHDGWLYQRPAVCCKDWSQVEILDVDFQCPKHPRPSLIWDFPNPSTHTKGERKIIQFHLLFIVFFCALGDRITIFLKVKYMGSWYFSWKYVIHQKFILRCIDGKLASAKGKGQLV